MARAKADGLLKTILRGAVAGVAASILLFANVAQAQDCKLRTLASLQIVEGPGGLFLVPVTVSGKQILMILDTGASRGVLDKTLATQLGLPLSKIATPQPIFAVPHQPTRAFETFPSQQYYLANGAKLDELTIVPSVSLGASQHADAAFMLANINSPDMPPLKGILGSDLLRDSDVEIDPRNGIIKLFAQDHCAGKVVYWADAYSDLPIRITTDGQIALTMTLDGHDVDTVLDTGAANTTLSLQIARQVFDIDTDAPTVEKISGSGRDTVYRTHFKTLAAGGISIAAPRIYLVRDALADRLREDAADTHHLMPLLTRTPQLILGMDVLRKLHLYIAYHESKLYITAADAGAPNSAKP